MRLGPYEILPALGVGGMGEVYRARDTKLNRDVAINVPCPLSQWIPSGWRASSVRPRPLASLNPPNIGAIHGLEDAKGVTALVLELVEGPTLADRIAKAPRRFRTPGVVARAGEFPLRGPMRCRRCL